MLPVQRLQLELALIDRQIQAARAPEPARADASREREQRPGDSASGEQTRAQISELAVRRAQVKRDFDRAYERALEVTG